MLAWGQQGTRDLHLCNSCFAVLPQPVMRSLWSLQGLSTTALPFPNPPYFGAPISALCFSASHHWGQGGVYGQLCEPQECRAGGKREVTRAAGGEEWPGEPFLPD